MKKIDEILFGKTADRITRLAVIAIAIYLLSMVIAIVITR